MHRVEQWLCTIIPRAASHENLSTLGWRVDSVDYTRPPLPPAAPSQSAISLLLRGDVDMYFERSRVRGRCGWGIVLYVPACETESPASSINWSREKAPMDMRSLSSAAAFLADMVCESFSST